jgi:hypothetical protein
VQYINQLRFLSLPARLLLQHDNLSLLPDKPFVLRRPQNPTILNVRGRLRRFMNHSHSLILFSLCRASHLFWGLWGILQTRTRFFILLLSVLVYILFFFWLGGLWNILQARARYMCVYVRAERTRARACARARERENASCVSRARENLTYAAFHTHT